MKLSRIIRRKKYRRHRRQVDRKIDLFADGKALNPKPLERLDPLPMDDEIAAVERSKQNGKGPLTVREAFEAFKKSHQNS